MVDKAGTEPRDEWMRPLTIGVTRDDDRYARRALLGMIEAHDPTLEREADRLVVVGSFADLTVRCAGEASLALRGPGEAPLPRKAVTHRTLGGMRVRDSHGAVLSYVLRLGGCRALVVPGRDGPGRDGRVDHVARFLGALPLRSVELAAPDLWAGTRGADVLAPAVAAAAERVTVAGATFDLTTDAGVGAWRLFAAVCVPHPAALAAGTGLR